MYPCEKLCETIEKTEALGRNQANLIIRPLAKLKKVDEKIKM